VDHLQEVGGGDIAHVEGRVLAQPDDIVVAKVDLGFGAIADVVAKLAPDFYRPAARHDPALDEGQPVRSVEEQMMPARLRLKRDAEGRIGVDVDRPDRVHLQGYLQGHRSLHHVWEE
jgi:hypothetical protein